MVVAAQKAVGEDGSLKGGRPPTPLDLIIEALFYRLRNAGPWRDLPQEFGPWRTVYGWHQRFVREGLWEKLLKRYAGRLKSKVRLIDGTHIVVHQSGSNPAGGASKQAMGKTRGGRNTKLMALTDARGRVVELKLVEGQSYEGSHVVGMLPLGMELIIVGDKGFDSDSLRREIEALGHQTSFAARSTRKTKVAFHKGYYRIRFRIENLFCRLKRWGSVSTRRDKLAVNFLAWVQFAALLDWMAA